jgi:hypothetical protein
MQNLNHGEQPNAVAPSQHPSWIRYAQALNTEEMSKSPAISYEPSSSPLSSDASLPRASVEAPLSCLRPDAKLQAHLLQLMTFSLGTIKHWSGFAGD